MRLIALLLMLGTLGASVHAATKVTVKQLRQYLTSPHTQKQRDVEIAQRLGEVTLSEQLTDRTLAALFASTPMGPQAREQLSLLAIASALRDPPKAEQPDLPFPNADQQKKWIDAVVAFANGNLQRLPDFLATRVTRSFDNAPQAAKPKHAPPRIEFHPVGELHREIAYRSGREEVDPETVEGGADSNSTAGVRNLSSWGEFGPVLTTVLGEAFASSVQFARWNAESAGNAVAVLHFVVPRSASHYLIDFCCYRMDEEAAWLPFRETAGYHGDIYFDPETGRVVRMRLEAELGVGEPVALSGIAVDYGQVQIGGKDYTCPVKSVAILVVQNLQMKKIDGEGLVTHLNETRFLNYRKFGSTTRVLLAGQAPSAD